MSFLHRNTCTALAKLAQMLTGAVASARDATVREPGFVHVCAAAASAARWPQPSSSHEDSCTMDEEDARAAMSARATCSIIVPFARHIRDARGHEVFGYENLCVRRVHKILCTEKGRFEGYLVDILFISSLFKNALNLLLKCDLIYYSSVCMDDQVLAP